MELFVIIAAVLVVAVIVVILAIVKGGGRSEEWDQHAYIAQVLAAVETRATEVGR